jgi:CRP/FNR family transcriptional regulator, nitrogen oxide reductase regulator
MPGGSGIPTCFSDASDNSRGLCYHGPTLAILREGSSNENESRSMDKSTIDLLSGAFLFRDLNPDDLTQVILAAHTRAVSRDEFFFHQGDAATSLYVLLDGEARLLQLAPDGNQVLLRLLAAGELFGGIAFLGEATYPVSVQAVRDCTAASWDGETMARLMEHSSRIAFNAMRHMADRIEELQDRLRELATERVERRIASALLRLAQQSGQKTPEGVLITLTLSRQDLAEMTGTTLYTVSRTLSRWEQQGIVEAGRERVLVRSPHGLVAIAEDLPPPNAPKTSSKE